jgi:hypothetical protein
VVKGKYGHSIHEVKGKVLAKAELIGSAPGDLSVNLDIKNPNAKEDITHLPPEQLAESILRKERQIAIIAENKKPAIQRL